MHRKYNNILTKEIVIIIIVDRRPSASADTLVAPQKEHTIRDRYRILLNQSLFGFVRYRAPGSKQRASARTTRRRMSTNTTRGGLKTCAHRYTPARVPTGGSVWQWLLSPIKSPTTTTAARRFQSVAVVYEIQAIRFTTVVGCVSRVAGRSSLEFCGICH